MSERVERTPLGDIDEQLAKFREALLDPNMIPLTLDLPMAINIAAMLQLALRHDGVAIETPHAATVTRMFVDGLIRAIVARSGENAEQIAWAFERGWNDRYDVTSEEFDRMMENSLDVDAN